MEAGFANPFAAIATALLVFLQSALGLGPRGGDAVVPALGDPPAELASGSCGDVALHWEMAPDEAGGRLLENDFGEPIRVESEAILAREHVLAAGTTRSTVNNDWIIDITLDREGAQILAAETEGNVGRRLVIVVDDAVLNAAVLRDRILSGRMQLTLPFQDEERVRALGDCLAGR